LKRTRVLIVDDSAFARKVLRQVLSRSRNIEVVGAAHDGLDALERITELQPDVITLDLVMPNLDGVGVLQALRTLDIASVPRVVVVSMSDPQGDLAISALREGAVDLVQKPTALANDRLYELTDELTRKVEAAGGARASTIRSPTSPPAPADSAQDFAWPVPKHALVVIGASTGGPQAVSLLLAALPRDFPVPIAVVVHIPVGFSESLAEHLNRDCAIAVAEASDGLVLRPGLAVIAQAGVHLTFEHDGQSYVARLRTEPSRVLHRPSLDVMFESAARACGAPVLGIVLTGMGRDGLEGARAIHRSGGTVLTQAEPSSVVYGMPRAVWEDSLATAQADIEEMPALLRTHL
jgi:two-component system, chemotaxis family, protein-glutamate methylesterase/glutaminase